MPKGVYKRKPRTLEHCAALSKARPPRTPGHRAALSASHTSERRTAMSETMKNSEAAEAANDKQRGGDDIVGHHYIYDHVNPKNHIVKITRSEHTSHHAWMGRNGIEVPHVNEHIPWRY